ncbi:MAG: M23 family metallopeptidase [Treponema sp.]|jgi:murein DD-endopeptidase MepM/ murein hydrolase activator NlpD|nr:M23 family metallopeptidase [Treponema sp.]
MSNIAIKQHVKRRTKVKPPPPSFHQIVDRDYSSRVFKRSLKRRRMEKRDVAGEMGEPKRIVPQHDIPIRNGGSRGRKGIKKSSPGRTLGQFLFGPEGLFPLPAMSPGTGEGRSGPSFPLSPIIAALITVFISVAAINWKMPLILALSQEPSLGAANSGALGLTAGGLTAGGLTAGYLGDEAGRNLAFYAGLSTERGLTPEETGEIPLDLMETFAWNEYKVQRGDTLSEIAKAQDLDLGTLIASNGITNARRLREGEILRIPNMDGLPYTVQAGDSLSGISSSSSVPLQVILDVNDLDSDVISPGMTLFLPGARMPQEDIRLALGESFIYPVRATLSSPYGWRIDPIAKVERFHSAIDLAAPLGTPVKAAMDGRVSMVAVNSVYGNYIILTHQGGYQSLYAHLNTVSVKQGASVTQNSKIGEVGSTGYSTGPHLHFAVFRNNKPINPLEVIQR